MAGPQFDLCDGFAGDYSAGAGDCSRAVSISCDILAVDDFTIEAYLAVQPDECVQRVQLHPGSRVARCCSYVARGG